ncbi:hypothetical protein ACQ86D_02695 [Streptomyces galilaeus]
MIGRDGAVRYRWAVLAVATFTQAASGFFVQGIGAMGIVLRHELGLTAAQLGLLISRPNSPRCQDSRSPGSCWTATTSAGS